MKSRKKKASSSAEQWDRLVAVSSSRLEVNKTAGMAPSGPPRQPFVRQERSQPDMDRLGIAQILASIASDVNRSQQTVSGPSSAQTNGNFNMITAPHQHQTPFHPNGPQTVLNSHQSFQANGSLKQEKRPGPNPLAMGNAMSSMLGSKPHFAGQHLPNSPANLLSPPLPNGYLLSPPTARCCPGDVPNILLQILDHHNRAPHNTTPLLEHLQQFKPYESRLCHDHWRKWMSMSVAFLIEAEVARAAQSFAHISATPSTFTATVPHGVPSPPADDQPPAKRQRIDGVSCAASYYDCAVACTPQTHCQKLDHGWQHEEPHQLHHAQRPDCGRNPDSGLQLHHARSSGNDQGPGQVQTPPYAREYDPSSDLVHAPRPDHSQSLNHAQRHDDPQRSDFVHGHHAVQGPHFVEASDLVQRPDHAQKPGPTELLEHAQRPVLAQGFQYDQGYGHAPTLDFAQKLVPAPRLGPAPTLGYVPTVDHGPKLDKARDEEFRRRVVQELQAKPSLEKGKSHGDVTGRLVLKLLQLCQSPDDGEAYVLTGQEAAAKMEAGPTDCPIFTEGQQLFNWDADKRPVEQMFRRMENLNRAVSVQVPSRKSHNRSFEKHKLLEIQQRFLDSGNADTDDPWNILDLSNPLPPTTMPKFLAGENCQLLPRVRDAVLAGSSGERTVASKEKWNEWLNVMDWVLMSQGGHNTAPHTDSHGLSTWITVQEGLFGFGWLSKPTKEEQDAWIANPQEFTGGRWRFTVLSPGKTVFFPSGTIHFVFRLRQGQTLALGGHILQWNGVERWINVVREQMRSPHITNEDVEWSAPKYVRVITDLIKNRVNNGRVDELGGKEVVDRFLTQVEVSQLVQLHGMTLPVFC